MGIKGLTRLIADNASDAIKEDEMKNYFGRKVAIDASTFLYQFLAAIRVSGESGGNSYGLLTDENGEITSHLQGMFSRSIRLTEAGLKPVFVFDGAPPKMKDGELAKRKERKIKAEEAMKRAEEEGNEEDRMKFAKQTIRVTSEMNEDAKKLIRLMGIPVVQAPCEAEAQCAELAKGGKVWATGTEDMDSLTLGTPILLRHLVVSEAKKLPVKEIRLEKVLEGMNLSMEQFVDFCILCGCDYTDTIRGIGGKRALTLIQEHHTIDEVLAHLDKEKYPVPEYFPYEEARKLFLNPDVIPADDVPLQWSAPDEEGLIKFMVDEKGFALERIQKGIDRIKKARTSSNRNQSRLESFFKVVPKESSFKPGSKTTPEKRKAGVTSKVSAPKRAKK